MSRSRSNEWSRSREVYTADQVGAVLAEIGVDVRDETDNDFLSFCPYHGNSDTPAFSTSKRYGYSICFNPACAAGATKEEGPLTLERLVRQIGKVSPIEAKRLIYLKKNASGASFRERFDAVAITPEELPEFPPQAIDKMHERFKTTPAAVEYMLGRGFTKETLSYFKIGFTPATVGRVDVYRPYDMVVVPAYDHKSRPVGLVGRTIVGKEFKNYGPGPGGRGFHKSHMIWNLNNARKHDTVIICESTFDAMRIHQAGYPNVVALLGGTLSDMQEDLLKRHFSKVIIFTDNETEDSMVYHKKCRTCLGQKFDMCQGHKPGRELGLKIAQRLPNLRTFWAAYDDKQIYARNVKDATDMTDDEIRQCLRNAVSHYEYLEWVA